VVGSKNWQVKYLCKFISASFFVVVRQQQPGRCVVGEMHLKTLSGTLGNCRRLGQRSDLIEVRLPTRSTDRQTDKPTVRVAGETLFNNCFLFFLLFRFFFAVRQDLSCQLVCYGCYHYSAIRRRPKRRYLPQTNDTTNWQRVRCLSLLFFSPTRRLN